MQHHAKKLYRSTSNRKIAGVCGGIGEYISVDPTVIRLLWILITLFTGIFPGLAAYFISIFIIEENPVTILSEPKD
jgi:phage shock protein PspC (stress-responsive transcriptional regulator)